MVTRKRFSFFCCKCSRYSKETKKDLTQPLLSPSDLHSFRFQENDMELSLALFWVDFLNKEYAMPLERNTWYVQKAEENSRKDGYIICLNPKYATREVLRDLRDIFPGQLLEHRDKKNAKTGLFYLSIPWFQAATEQLMVLEREDSPRRSSSRR